jgi:D-3-phosphoglycerate dehydrogenase
VLVLTPGPPEDLVAALDTALGGDWELVTPGPDADHEALHGLLAEVDVVLGDWSGRWRLSAAEAAVARRVRLVQQPGVGVEFIDPAAWAVHGIPVANAAGTNATAVAEWCVAAVLVLLRSMCWADAAVRGGRWPSAAETLPRVRELRGLRVGLIGLGPIGAACAQRLRTFDCALSYWSRTRRRPDDEHGATYRELDDLVATSDVLVVAVALTEQTRGLVGQERLARLPTGAVVVNVARGAVVDEVALARGLQEGRLGGAALDVFATEPLPADSPLRDAPNVLFSPHVGGATAPARERTLAAAAGNVSRAVRGEPLMSVLNGIGSSVPTLPPAGSPAENRSAS